MAKASIKPTVGRVVYYYPKSSEGLGDGPLAAIVCHVHNDGVVNLGVLGPDGTSHARQSVILVQDGDDTSFFLCHCEWMPFQKGQAAKTEKVTDDYEKRLNLLGSHVQRLRDENANLSGRIADLESKPCQQSAKPSEPTSTESSGTPG